MALAPFFQKAALAGSHLLQDFDSKAFADILLGHVVEVVFDEEAVGTHEGRVTLELSVNLLARLYPCLVFTAVSGTEDSKREAQKLVELARSINPNIDILEGNTPPTLCVVVGTIPVERDSPTFYLGSDGWAAGFSPDAPVGSGCTSNPFGACAAACFGAANLFRATFSRQLKGAAPDSTMMVSLLDLDRREDLPNPPINEVQLGEVHLVGVGAIGNAAVWSMSRAPFLSGVLHLIDHEAIDETNPQRYVLAAASDTGQSKVLRAAKELSGTSLQVVPHQMKWGEYLGQRGNWNFERVAVALDTPEDRCAVQACLPQWIVNAWTQPQDLGVSRHGFGNGQACLMCLYMPSDVVPDLDDQIRAALRLPEDDATLRQVRHLLVTGEPIGKEWVERIATANGVSAQQLLELQSLPIRAFYQKTVCGGIMLSLGVDPDNMPRHTEVPMAFQSALAGVLLAAELVAHATGLKDTPPPVTTKVDLLKPLGIDLSLPSPQHPAGKCICQDPDYVDAYRDKYNQK